MSARMPVFFCCLILSFGGLCRTGGEVFPKVMKLWIVAAHYLFPVHSLST